MTMDKFSNSLFDRLVICDKKVSPVPQVAGEEVPEFKVTLSMADTKNAFVAMGTGEQHHHHRRPNLQPSPPTQPLRSLSLPSKAMRTPTRSLLTTL